MGILIVKEELVGKFKTAINAYDGVDSFITQYEKNYLYDLLGVELADLFIANLTNKVPVAARFLALYNVIELDVYCRLRSAGMKDMLLGFIYFEYQRKQSVTPTITGNVRSLGENSTNISPDYSPLYLNYNSSISTYQIIQYYIGENSIDYPEYNGVSKQKTSII